MIAAQFGPVDAASLPNYPIPVGVRLESHGWFQFHHAWWRTSDFRRDADREVRAVWFDLLSGAQDEDPVGTLPVASRDLAWIARVSLEDWMRLMDRPINPLYGWKKCICSDDRVRLYHPKLLEVTKGAARSSVVAEEKREQDRERKRLKDLPDKIVRAGGSQRMAGDPGYVLRLDQFLIDNSDGAGTRTITRVGVVRNAYGNMPKGALAKMLANPDVFIASSGDPRTAHLQPGIYKRGGRGIRKGSGRRGGGYGTKGNNWQGKGQKRSTLQMLVAFESSATYDAKPLDFFGVARAKALSEFRQRLEQQLAEAIRTAR